MSKKRAAKDVTHHYIVHVNRTEIVAIEINEGAKVTYDEMFSMLRQDKADEFAATIASAWEMKDEIKALKAEIAQLRGDKK